MKGERFAHGPPTGQHFGWAQYQIDDYGSLMQAMGITGIVLSSDSDNIVKTWDEWRGTKYEDMSIVQVLASQFNIRTVGRINNWLVGELFTDMYTATCLAAQLEQYGMEAVLAVGNEPRLKEWKGPIKGKKYDAPPDWFPRYNGWFYESASVVERCGCTPGFADAPNQTQSPYALATDNQKQAWVDGRYLYCGHFYPHDTPPEFPWLDWVQTGEPMTWAEYDAIVGELRDTPPWSEHTLDVINATRREKIGDPDSIWDITVFWKEWMRHQEWMEEAFGQQVRIAATEGGWTPGTSLDGRMPPTTPNQVAEYTYYVFDVADHPLEFQAPWILMTELIVPGIGWPDDAWLTTNELFRELYGQWKPGDPELLKYAMPVVWKLMENGSDCPWDQIVKSTQDLLEIVKGG